MYIVVLVFLAASSLGAAIAHFFITDVKWAGVMKTVSLISGAAGITSLAVEVSVFYALGKYDEWAYDVISGYFKDVLPALCIVLAIVLLSAAFQPKMKLLRSSVIFLSSTLALIYGQITSMLPENDTSKVTVFIKLFSISIYLIINFCGYFDFKKLEKKLTK